MAAPNSDVKRKRLLLWIYLGIGVPMLGLMGLLVYNGQNTELPIFVLNDSDERVRIELCGTWSEVPAKSRAEVRTACLFGAGELVAKSEGRELARHRLDDLNSAGLIYNVGGRSTLALADYSRAYHVQRLVEIRLPGIGASPPDFPAPRALGGEQIVVLPPSYPLLGPEDPLPNRVKGEGSILRLEAVPEGMEGAAHMGARFAKEPPPSAPRTRGWPTWTAEPL